MLAAGEREPDELEKTARRLDANHLFAARQFFLRMFASLGSQLVLRLVLNLAVFCQFSGSSLLLWLDADSLAEAARQLFGSYYVHCREQAVSAGITEANQIAVPVLDGESFLGSKS